MEETNKHRTLGVGRSSNNSSQPNTTITFQNNTTHIQETRQKEKLYYGENIRLRCQKTWNLLNTFVRLTKSLHLSDLSSLLGKSSRRIKVIDWSVSHVNWHYWGQSPYCFLSTSKNRSRMLRRAAGSVLLVMHLLVTKTSGHFIMYSEICSDRF